MACAGIAALLTMGAQGAELAPIAERADFTPDECSIGLWVRFDGGWFAPDESQGSPSAAFALRRGKDGRVNVSLKALPTEVLGDFELYGRDAVPQDEWHHYEITYSRVTKRATFAIDGRFQWENDCLQLPRLAPFPAAWGPTDDFKGDVKGVCVWDAARTTEEILPAGDHDANPLDTVAKRKFDAKIAANLKTLAPLGSKFGATYVVPVSSQEPYLPYELPRTGLATNRIDLVTAPGEHEAASFVYVAKTPLTVKDVKVTLPAGFSSDVWLVKRWFRTGGAWASYHSDRRQRVLTPDLLLHDDGLIKVDEQRRKNYLRLDYPTGRIYADVTDPSKGHQDWFGWLATEEPPLRDAKTLQPVAIPEAGRNQQFVIKLDVAKTVKPGLHRGEVRVETDKGAEALAFFVRVLPVELPEQAAPMNDPDGTWISHMNSFPLVLGQTNEERVKFVKDVMKRIHDAHVNQTTGLWDSPKMVELAKEAGFVADQVHGTKFAKPRDWREFYPKALLPELTSADKEAGIRASMREKQTAREYHDLYLPGALQWSIYVSESSWYTVQQDLQAEVGEVAHRLGQQVFAHGHERNGVWATDVQDMHSDSGANAKSEGRWHAAGGRVIAYCDPFPGAENPMIFRFGMGFYKYRLGYDGDMLHGFLNQRVPFNEWAEDYGGDGNYRNFAMVFPQQGGIIWTLAWEGVREANNDLRWLTKMVRQARAAQKSADETGRREGKRQMVWLENLDGRATDLDMMRAGVQRRILLLAEMLRKKGGAR